ALRCMLRRRSPARGQNGRRSSPSRARRGSSGSSPARTGRSPNGQPCVRRTSARRPTDPCRSWTTFRFPTAAGASCPRGSEACPRCGASLPRRPASPHEHRDHPCEKRAGSDARSRASAPYGSSLFLTEREAAEALVEARDLAATVEQLLVAAGPGRVHAGVDIEVERVPLFAPSRTGLELGAVGHFDRDHVIIGVGTGFHLCFPRVSRWFPTSCRRLNARLYRRGGEVATETAVRRAANEAPELSARAMRNRRTGLRHRTGLRPRYSGRTGWPRCSRPRARPRYADRSRWTATCRSWSARRTAPNWRWQRLPRGSAKPASTPSTR